MSTTQRQTCTEWEATQGLKQSINPCTVFPFDTDSDSFWYFDGAIWRSIDKLLLEDADQDTKVQVEESADEDVIRFDVEGIEVMRHDGKTLHAAADGESLFIGVDAGVNDDGRWDGSWSGINASETIIVRKNGKA